MPLSGGGTKLTLRVPHSAPQCPCSTIVARPSRPACQRGVALQPPVATRLSSVTSLSTGCSDSAARGPRAGRTTTLISPSSSVIASGHTWRGSPAEGSGVPA